MFKAGGETAVLEDHSESRSQATQALKEEITEGGKQEKT